MLECTCCWEKYENNNLMKVPCGKNNAYIICKKCLTLLNIDKNWNENNEYFDNQHCSFCGEETYNIRNYEYNRLNYYGYVYKTNELIVGIYSECSIPEKFVSNIK